MNCKHAIGEPSREEVWRMFDRIAPRYDFLNRLLSFRQDVRWRKKMAGFLPDKTSLSLLDLATGTGDQLISLMKHSSNIQSATGLDMSEKMLVRGREKIKALAWEDRIQLKLGNATALELENASFDVLTISFGMRNMLDVDNTLREMFRVLKTGGRILVLESSLPSRAIVKGIYLLYLRHILPYIGGWIAGDRSAYRYLNQTVETFPYGEAFCEKIAAVGFNSVEAYPLSCGIVTLYVGEKWDEH